jgi:hypothetical protein
VPIGIVSLSHEYRTPSSQPGQPMRLVYPNETYSGARHHGFYRR